MLSFCILSCEFFAHWSQNNENNAPDAMQTLYNAHATATHTIIIITGSKALQPHGFTCRAFSVRATSHIFLPLLLYLMQSLHSKQLDFHVSMADCINSASQLYSSLPTLTSGELCGWADCLSHNGFDCSKINFPLFQIDQWITASATGIWQSLAFFFLIWHGVGQQNYLQKTAIWK